MLKIWDPLFLFNPAQERAVGPVTNLWAAELRPIRAEMVDEMHQLKSHFLPQFDEEI